jgi:hypothetical protein
MGTIRFFLQRYELLQAITPMSLSVLESNYFFHQCRGFRAVPESHVQTVSKPIKNAADAIKRTFSKLSQLRPYYSVYRKSAKAFWTMQYLMIATLFTTQHTCCVCRKSMS